MLIKFAVKNFRNFSERIEFDLTRPKAYEFNSFAVKNGIIKNGIIYGPNGSGKSNFGFAIFDLVTHLTQKWKNAAKQYNNFIFAGAQNDCANFEYTFRFGEDTIVYAYSKNAYRELKVESLCINSKQIFQKNNNSFFLDESFSINEETRKTLCASENNISILGYLTSFHTLDRYDCLKKMRDFFESMLWFRCLEDRGSVGLEPNAVNIDEYIIRKGLQDDFSDFLENISGQKYRFVKSNLTTDKYLFCIINGVSVLFGMVASTGTRCLTLLYYWLKRMDKASFVFIDEFDAFYHFALAFNVCKNLFKKESQIFLSSHNTYLMTNDLLRPDCNFILDNNAIKPLCDCTEKELKFAHNIEKLFRGGTFKI